MQIMDCFVWKYWLPLNPQEDHHFAHKHDHRFGVLPSCIYIYVHVYIYMYMYIYIYICTCIYIYVHVYIYTYIYIYIHMYTSLSLSTYIYIYIHTILSHYIPYETVGSILPLLLLNFITYIDNSTECPFPFGWVEKKKPQPFNNQEVD